MLSSNTSQVAAGGYQISRSLRFNSADSAYLNRTPASAGNRRTWTWSGWVKISSLSSTNGYLFTTTDADINNATYIYLNGNTLRYWDNTGSGGAAVLTTSAVYRDVSAWYHIVLAVDTTQATSSNRARLYVNGVEVTAFSTANYPAQNTNSYVNDTVAHYIGAPTRYFNGYMTEINFIDGQALTPSSFGETNAQTGVWQPKAYSGSYGTNGFYLNFSDNSNTTAATLGKDYSGNGNNWTPNNFSVAAGAGNDSLVDTPTPYGSDSGAGGEVRGNYCTWNPLAADSSATITNGNLDVATAAAGVGQARGTIGVSSGKWYWEVTRTTSGANLIVGIVDSATGADKFPGQTSGSYGYYGLDGTKINNGSFSAYGASFGIGDVIGVALDLDAGTLVFYKNGTSQGTAFTGLSGTFFPAASDDTGGGGMNYWGNFGQRPFAYTAPSGFKALCTQNLPTPAIGATTATQAGKFFNPVLYTGTQTTQSVTGVGFQPDFTWIKDRTTAWTNVLTDAVRGAGKSLYSNSTDPEVTNDSNGYLSAFNSDGFTLAGGLRVNASGDAIVAWNWKANGAGVTNTAGSITSTVSANTTSGFSIVTYTGNGANATVGHGLGVAPSMIIVKSRSAGSTDWRVFASVLNDNSKWLALNTTAAATTESGYWNTGVSSTVFGIGPYSYINDSGSTYVAYCFAAISGYSAFGSYTGNSSTDGPFVFCGFRPRYILVKCSSESIGPGSGWHILDTARNPYNVAGVDLFANESYSEATIGTTNYLFDLNSNGFKVRTSDNYINKSGQTYIFAAFAEAPFKYALAR